MSELHDRNHFDLFEVGSRVRVVTIYDDNMGLADERNIGRIGTIVEVIDERTDTMDYGTLWHVAFDDQRDTAETQTSTDREAKFPLNHSAHWSAEMEIL